MFMRLWSGLPKDPVFPSDLDGLGCYINEIDEIRQTDNPKFYFKFFTYKNERWNERQRFHMNEAVQKVVFQRLEGEGLVKTLLPLGTTDPAQPNVPIFTSRDLDKKSRMVLIFGETCQDLGILAHRICGGVGGVNKGSMVSIVRAIKNILSPSSSAPSPSSHSSSNDEVFSGKQNGDGKDETTKVPGVILANTGQLWWWPEGKRALGPVLRHAVPMKSSVHMGRHTVEEQNTVSGNRNPDEHVRYVFEEVVPSMVSANTKLDVIAIGNATDLVEKYLGSEENWSKWSARMNSLALVGGFYPVTNVQAEGFREFLKNRTRAWVANEKALNDAVSGPEGNKKSASFTGQGCPVFSAGNVLHTELLLAEIHDAVLRWMAEVHAAEDYKNPPVDPTPESDDAFEDVEYNSSPWPEFAAREAEREAKWKAELKQKEEEKAAEAKRKADKKAVKQQALKEKIEASKKAKEAGKILEVGDTTSMAQNGHTSVDDEKGLGSVVNKVEAMNIDDKNRTSGHSETSKNFDPLEGHDEAKAQLRQVLDTAQQMAFHAFGNPSVLPSEDWDDYDVEMKGEYRYAGERKNQQNGHTGRFNGIGKGKEVDDVNQKERL